MGGLFGKEKAPAKAAPPAVSEADRAVIKLKAQRDRLRKFQKRVRRAHSGGTRMRRG